MSRITINDLSVERTLSENETDEIVGAGGHFHFGSHGGGVHWGGGSVHWGGHGHHHHHHRPRFHDTSHYDYHPGRFRRHGNHYHYTPSHYHLHRSGHYHY